MHTLISTHPQVFTLPSTLPAGKSKVIQPQQRQNKLKMTFRNLDLNSDPLFQMFLFHLVNSGGSFKRRKLKQIRPLIPWKSHINTIPYGFL